MARHLYKLLWESSFIIPGFRPWRARRRPKVCRIVSMVMRTGVIIARTVLSSSAICDPRRTSSGLCGGCPAEIRSGVDRRRRRAPHESGRRGRSRDRQVDLEGPGGRIVRHRDGRPLPGSHGGADREQAPGKHPRAPGERPARPDPVRLASRPALVRCVADFLPRQRPECR